MNKTLKQIFDEAFADRDAVTLNGVGYLGRLSMGFKIVKDEKTHDVKIFNTHFGGDNYKELTFEEYFIVQDKGWKCGIITLSLSTLESKIKSIRVKLNENPKKNSEELEEHLMFLEERYREALKKKAKYCK